MGKYADGLLALAGVLIGSFLATGFFDIPLWTRIVVALLALFAGCLVFVAVVSRQKARGTGIRDFVTYCVLDPGYADKAFVAVYPDAVRRDDVFLLRDGAACIHAKIASLSPDAIVGYYRKFVAAGATRGFVVCNDCPRSASAFAASLPGCPVYVLSFRNLYRRAKKRGAVGPCPSLNAKRPFKTVLFAFFSRKNSYRLAACSLVLFALSGLTFLKTYYLVCGFVVAALAVAARVIGSGHEKSDNIENMQN